MSNYPPSSDPWEGEAARGPGGPPLASWGLRVGATLVDSLIGFAISCGGWIVAAIMGSVSDALGVFFTIISGLIGLAFTIWNSMIRQGQTGQTLGKTVLKIRVARLDGQVPPGIGLCVGRYFLHFLDALPCLLGFLWPLWDEKRQTFTDKILNTVVVTT